MKKSEILKQREIHRGDPRGLVLAFITNYSAPTRLMRAFLPPDKRKEDLLQAAMRSYIIGMAACIETFFRDLYFCLLKRNPALLQRALNEGNRTESASRLPRYLAEGVSAEEFAASASFQNAESINQNLSIFFTLPFLGVLDQFELVCDISAAGRSESARLKLPSCWQSDLARTFSLRHEFAHDANSKTRVSTEEMRSMETSALLICQMTALLPGINPEVMVSEKQLPVIFLIDDLIADDWELAENETVAR